MIDLLLQSIIEQAKALGCSEVEVNGVTYRFNTQTPHHEANRALQTPPVEAKATELITPLSVFDEPTEDEVLYYATPYYDQLQADKAEMERRKKEGTVTDG